ECDAEWERHGVSSSVGSGGPPSVGPARDVRPRRLRPRSDIGRHRGPLQEALPVTTDPSELDGAPDAQDEVLLGDATVPPAAAAAPSTGDAPQMPPPSPSGPAPAPATTPDDPEAPVPPAHTPSEPLDTDDEEVLGDPSVTHPVA